MAKDKVFLQDGSIKRCAIKGCITTPFYQSTSKLVKGVNTKKTYSHTRIAYLCKYHFDEIFDMDDCDDSIRDFYNG